MLDKLPPWKRKKSGAKPKTKLSAHQVEAARERAKQAKRRYPNLVDNMWAAKHVPREPDAKPRGDSPLMD